MKKYIDYIETSCSKLKDDHMTYLYKKHILDRMTARANEITSAGLTDESVLTDLLADEFGDLEAGYNDFLETGKKKRRRKLINIGSLVSFVLLLVSYFVVSDLTGAWGKHGSLLLAESLHLLFSISVLQSENSAQCEEFSTPLQEC